MIKVNNLSKWGLVIIISFGGGLIFSYLFRGSEPVKIIEKDLNPLKHIKRSQVELGQDARKKYQELMIEYTDYISNEQNKYMGFKEFISIRKDKLVQNKKYSEQDIRSDEEIKQWLSSYTSSEKDKNSLEVNRYSVTGTVVGPYKKKESCFILVNLYKLPLLDFTPAIPENAIGPEAPLASAFIDDCRGGSFDLDFMLSNLEDQETDAIYTAAYAFDGASNSYLIPLAFGTDSKINGIPPSLLAKRKNNSPIKIILKEIEKQKMESININIKSQKGLWALVYSLDSVAKLAPELNIYRTAISANDDIARLRGMPFGSNIYIQIFDPGLEHKIGMVIPSFSTKMDIQIQQTILKIKPRSSNASLAIIPPANISEGEILVSSVRSLKNKANFSFNDLNTTPLILDDMDTEETLIELKQNNKSLGITGITPKKNETFIINPVPKEIGRLSGNISLTKKLGEQALPCNNCSIEIKYTDKNTSTKANGTFNLDDINIIDNKIDLLIENTEQRFLVPLVIQNNIKKLMVKLDLPNQKLIELWNKSEPTLPINGTVYGSYSYHKSYRAFLKGINSPFVTEASYFDEAMVQPSKNTYSTSGSVNSPAFCKFLFSDVPSGEYVIYMITGPNIIHTRTIRVEPGTVTVIY